MLPIVLLALCAVVGSQEFVGVVHPIATGTFPGPEMPPPSEEDLTSPQNPAPQVAVTLPFVFQRPSVKDSKIPTSFLRPLMIDFQQNDGQQQQEDSSEEEMPPPSSPSKPLLEDLTSPIPSGGAAVTLPFVLAPTPNIPTSYLRPLIEEDTPSPTRNVGGAVTLPFASNYQIPSSYLRPIFPTDAADIQQDLPNGVQHLIYKPASYLRPWFISDDGMIQQQQDEPQQTRPSKVHQPLIAEEQRPAATKPLKPIKQQQQQKWTPLIIQNQRLPQNGPTIIIASMPANENPLVRPGWWIRPYQQQAGFVVDQQRRPVQRPWLLPVANKDGSISYQLIRPAAGSPKKVQKQSDQPAIQPGQSEGRVPFFANWMANSNNNNLTLLYTKNAIKTGTSTVYSTTVYTVTSVISNAYCFTSSSDPISASPWCSFRRKRDASDQDKAILTLQGEPIQPSQVQKILMTEMPTAPDCVKSASLESMSSSKEEPQEPQNPSAEGRFFNIQNQQQLVKIGQPTTTVLVTILTTATQISITSTTPIAFVGGQCVPRCLQNLPTCTVAPVVVAVAPNQPNSS